MAEQTHRERLVEIRDHLTGLLLGDEQHACEECGRRGASASDAARLSAELRSVLVELAGMPDAQVKSRRDELRERRAQRQAEAAAGVGS